jgi:hypothetical protein
LSATKAPLIQSVAFFLSVSHELLLLGTNCSENGTNMIDNPGMRLFLTYVLLGMPALGIASYFRLKSGKPLPAKLRRYRAVIALQLLLLALSIIVANQNAIELFGPEWPSGWSWTVAAAYVLLIGMSLKRGFRKLNEQRREPPGCFFPRTRSSGASGS